MKDGDVVHEWDSDQGFRFSARSVKMADGTYRLIVFLAGWNEIQIEFTRTDARELLVAFDKLEAEQNKQRGPLSVEIDGLPGRYLPGLDGQPVRVDGNLEGWA